MSLSFYKINVINNTDLHFHSIVPFSLSHQLPMPSIKLVWNLLSKFGILSAMCQVTCVSCRLKYLTSLAIPSPSTTNLFLCLYLMSLAEYFKWSQRHVHLAPISPLLICLVGCPIRRCLFKFLLLFCSSQYQVWLPVAAVQHVQYIHQILTCSTLHWLWSLPCLADGSHDSLSLWLYSLSTPSNGFFSPWFCKTYMISLLSPLVFSHPFNIISILFAGRCTPEPQLLDHPYTMSNPRPYCWSFTFFSAWPLGLLLCKLCGSPDRISLECLLQYSLGPSRWLSWFHQIHWKPFTTCEKIGQSMHVCCRSS